MGGIWMETEACEVLQKVAFFIEMCARLLLAVTLEEILGGPTSKSSRRVGRCRQLPMFLHSDLLNNKPLAQSELGNNILSGNELLSISFDPVCVTVRL